MQRNKRIAAELLARGMSKTETAEMVGVHRNTIAQWERKGELLRAHDYEVAELLDAMSERAIETEDSVMARLVMRLRDVL